MLTEKLIRELYDVVDEDITSLVYDNGDTLIMWEKPNNPIAKLLPLVKELGLTINQSYIPYTYLLFDTEKQILMQLEIREKTYHLNWNNFDLVAGNHIQALMLICSYFDLELPIVTDLKVLASETADKGLEIKLNNLLNNLDCKNNLNIFA